MLAKLHYVLLAISTETWILTPMIRDYFTDWLFEKDSSTDCRMDYGVDTNNDNWFSDTVEEQNLYLKSWSKSPT